MVICLFILIQVGGGKSLFVLSYQYILSCRKDSWGIEDLKKDNHSNIINF